MADDYKNIASPTANQKKRSLTPPLLLLVGLVAGGGFATWFMWPVESTTTPGAINPSTPPGQLQNKIIPEPTPTNVDSPQANDPEQPLEQPLDFYTVLPQMEVPLIKTPETAVSEESKKPTNSKSKPSPSQRTSRDTPTPSKPIPAPAPVGKYYLQVGSFQDQQAATELQHKIDGLGLKADIQKVRLLNDGVWYRVQVGPFRDLESSDQAQQILDQHNIRYTLMKQTLHKQG